MIAGHRILLGIAALFALLHCAGAEAKTLTFCSEGSPENFNPQINTTGTSLDASFHVYNRLVEFERGSTKLIPGLAESWTVSEDGRVYTFRLRRGVRFHASDGFAPTRDFTAEDVLFSLERQWRADHPFHRVSGGAYDYFRDMDMPRLLKAVDRIDDHTVRIELEQPEAPFLANLAMDFASILSAEYGAQAMAAGTPEQIDQVPIGTGPFRFVEYRKDEAIRFQAFDRHWNGKPAIDELVYAITRDPAQRYAKLKSGACQAMAYPSPADLSKLRQDREIALLSQEGLNIGYLAFNTQKKPFDDQRVRKALNMAIDKRAIVDDVYLGAGVPAINPIPPTLWSYNISVRDWLYDPVRAKALLAEAGLPGGFETDLWAMPVQRAYNPDARRVAEMIRNDLAKIGVTVRIVSVDWSEYRSRVEAGEHQMAQFGWTGDNGDPDNFLYVLLGCAAARPGGSNIAKWCHQPFDDLVVAAKRTPEIAKRTALYEEAQKIFKEQAPWFPIAHSVVFVPVRREVRGFRISPFGRHQFDGVRMD